MAPAVEPPIHNPSNGDDEETTVLFAMHLASLSVLPMTLKAAIELNVFNIMAKAGPGAYISPAEIAAQLPTQNPDAPEMLDRMLRLLASSSVLKCSITDLGEGSVERRYGLAPVCKYYVDRDDGVFAAASPLALLIQDKVLMESWYYLKDAVLEGGIPFTIAYGMNPYEYAGTDPRFNKVFNNCSLHHSTFVMKKILDIYKGFDGLGNLADVGGSIGVALKLIVSKYPQIKGINFDLKHVIDSAPSYPGIQHVIGDMFTSVPSADAIFLKSILHNWGDEQCLTILKNCHKALPENGKVIIVSMILPEIPENTLQAREIFTTDMCMLAQQPKGKTRTRREYERLAMAAGFTRMNAINCFMPDWVLEMLK